MNYLSSNEAAYAEGGHHKGETEGKLSCGMSLLIEPAHLEAVRDCIAAHRAEYYDIVPLEGQMKSHRDKYC